MTLQRTYELLVPENQRFGPIQAARYNFAIKHCKRPLVLDAACGIGIGTSMLAQAGYSVAGVDIDERCILLAARHFNAGPFAFINADIFDPSWQKEVPKFGTIVSIETLEHLPEAARAVSLLYDMLPSGGRLIATTPNEENYPFASLPPEEFEGNPWPHVRHYTPFEFGDLIESPGFEVEGLWHQPGELKYDSEGQRTGKRCKPRFEPGPGGLFLVVVAVKP